MMVLLMAALLALAPPQSAQTKSVIEGRVLRSGTTEPIPNVQVTLTGAPTAGAAGTVGNTSGTPAELASRIQALIDSGNRAGQSQAAIDSAVATLQNSAGASAQQTSIVTDSSGHFSFRDLAPGKYSLRATRDGFYGPPLNGSASTVTTKSVVVEAQKPVPATDLFMVQGGIISGRVRDPNGQPASGITVAATRVTYANGRPQWTTAGTKATDDRGEYRIFWLPPGEYNVGVTPRPISTVPGPQDSWIRTFFPGVSDPTTASALTIKDGSESDGIDFTIQTTGLTVTFKITGKATNPLAAPNPTTGVVDRNLNTFLLAPREPGILDSVTPPSVQNALAASARPNGEFEIRNVRPGSYDLISYTTAPVPPPVLVTPGTPTGPAAAPFRRYYIDRTQVDVRNADVDGVSLTIQKGTELNGRIVNQGTSALPLDKIRINLHSQDTIPETFATTIGAIAVDSTGVFTAPDIASARYSLQVTGLPDTAYVSDIRQGGTSIFDTGLPVGGAPQTSIDILVNSNGATVDGNVQGPDRKPAANATVVLVPPANHRSNAMMYKSAQTDDEGHFSMRGIPPGEFTLFAWESVFPTAWMNAEFLANYQNRGRPVMASQGTHLDAQLDLIPSDASRK